MDSSTPSSSCRAVRRTAAQQVAAILGILACLLNSACSSSTTPAPGGSSASSAPEPAARSQAEALAAEAQAKAELTKQAAARRQKLVADAQAAAAAEKWDELESALAALREPSPEADAADAPAEMETTLTELGKQLTAGRDRQIDRARSESLAKAQQWVASGRLDDAQQAIREVITRAPTDEQRETAQQLTQEIERVRKARRQLKSWLTMLGSAESREVQTAQTQLLQDPDTAVGMILESLRTTANADLASNYLDTLRQIGRSEVVVPVLLDLLRDDQHQALWPLITRDLPQLAGPGAGPALLNLAIQSTDDAQRRAALEALATSAEPPAESLQALTPLLDAVGPIQVAALRVMTRSVVLHGQRDLWAQRGLTDSPRGESVQPIEALPERLQAWWKSAPGAEGAASPELAREARRLAAVLGVEPGTPLAGIKVERAEAELPDGPAAAVLDGVWNSVDLKTMWRYSSDKRGSLLLDLGSERIVTGVRIWNWNEAAGGHRGWKEVEVFVSNSPAELNPVATGVVLPAPGAADTPDYGIHIPIPAVAGKYLRLQAKSNWTIDVHTGLAEVQVLGY